MSFFHAYFACWLAATLVAVSLIVRWDGAPELFMPRYWRFLAPAWKTGTFFVSVVAFCILSRYSNDPTWDMPESILLSILTFATAPWSVGVVLRHMHGYPRRYRELYVAACLCLFSSSWAYDAYVWAWLGFYPPTWLGNLMISPIIYLMAGVFWSLETRNGRIALAFMEEEWLPDRPYPLGKAVKFAMVFVGLMAFLFGWFLVANR